MSLEPVTQSEVNQKNNYCILIHIHRIEKYNNDGPIYREEMEMQAQRTDSQTQ